MEDCDMNSYLKKCAEKNSLNLSLNFIAENNMNSEIKVEENESPGNVKIQHSYLKRGEGLRRRFKMDPNKFHLNNLPRYSYASTYPNRNTVASHLKKKVMNSHTVNQQENYSKTAVSDTGEKKVEALTAKNINNSTTDLGMFQQISEQRLGLTINRFKSSPKTYLPLSWAKVLDPHHKSPQIVESVFSENVNDLSSFDLIETKGNMKKETNTLNSLPSDIPVREYLHKSGLRPTIKAVSIDESNSSEDDNEDLSKNKENTPQECNVVENESLDSVLSNRNKNHENNDAREDDESETIKYLNCYDDYDDIHDITLFEHFKKTLFLALQNRADENVDIDEAECTNDVEKQKLEELTSDNICNNKHNDIDSKVLKTRMAELEDAICTFKNNNLELIKARDEFELEKTHMNRKLEEIMAKLNDEKMQFEINMHDAHMKLEKEKRNLEQHCMHKSNRKEYKENIAMKAEVEELKKQLKQKEKIHSTSQSRLRMQIHNLCKEKLELTEKISNLSKENKKLEVEKMLITRESNNKMLQQINRNISRLATNPKCKSPSNQFKQKEIQISNNNELLSQTSDVSLKLSQSTKPLDTKAMCNNKDQTNHENIIYKKVKQTDDNNDDSKLISQNEEKMQKAKLNCEFKREIINKDGSKDIWYSNGNLKKISADGMNIRMLYFNKDIKETNIIDGMVKYYYADSNVWHTTYLDGLEILEFPNGQTEHRHKNGSVEVHFPNNSVKTINPNDEENLEEWRLSDGSKLLKKRNGDKVLVLPNGQREVHTTMSKRREYPDGTVKLIYPDGSQESRYSNGRIRLKNKEGNLIMDNAT